MAISIPGGSSRETADMTSLSETFLKKRMPDKNDLPRQEATRSGSPACLHSRPIKRILERWKECWRLAALPAPENTPVSRKPAMPNPGQPFQGPDGEYIPKAGMRGQNVEWVPCSPVVLDKMLEIAKVTPDDFVIDPGSGDGRIVIRVARLGARALGIESNPKLVALSRQNAEKGDVSDRAVFTVGDFFETDFSRATVITLFLRKDLNIALRPKLLDLKPGTRIVSNIFDMGDWEADEVLKVEDGDYYFRNHTVRLWIVPAKVDGIWELPEGELAISQKFQMIVGSLSVGGKTAPIEGRVTGDRIHFIADGKEYAGGVAGNRMKFTVNDSSNKENGGSHGSRAFKSFPLEPSPPRPFVEDPDAAIGEPFLYPPQPSN